MTYKRFFLGMLVLILAFGMTVNSCFQADPLDGTWVFENINSEHDFIIIAEVSFT